MNALPVVAAALGALAAFLMVYLILSAKNMTIILGDRSDTAQTTELATFFIPVDSGGF